MPSQFQGVFTDMTELFRSKTLECNLQNFPLIFVQSLGLIVTNGDRSWKQQKLLDILVLVLKI
jgi:hypothetical protein